MVSALLLRNDKETLQIDAYRKIGTKWAVTASISHVIIGRTSSLKTSHCFSVYLIHPH